MYWRVLVIAISIVTISAIRMDGERGDSANRPLAQDICASDTATWTPHARSFITSVLSETDYSSDGLPFRPSSSAIQVVTDQATCDAANTAILMTFGVPSTSDSILVVKVDTAAYVIFRSPDAQKGLAAGEFWTSSWSYLFMLVDI